MATHHHYVIVIYRLYNMAGLKMPPKSVNLSTGFWTGFETIPADLDPGLQSLRRPARCRVRPALRLCVTFRPRRVDAGPQRLSQSLSALGTALHPVCDGRLERLRGCNGRRSALSAELGATIDAQRATGTAQPLAATRGKFRKPAHTAGARPAPRS